MITLTKNGNAIVFTFSDNAHYLFDGTIEVPVNSLTLVTDNSQMATFRKSASNDIFISATYAELGMSKSELESWFKENACGSTGGGGVTSGEVETMIETSLEDYYDIDEVDAALSAKANTATTYTKTDVDNALANKADTSAVTASIAAAVSGKQDTLIAGSGITISGNVISSEGGNKVVELTQAQYDALVDKDPDTFYIITDAEAIDISNYYTKTAVDGLLSTKANTATTYNKTEVDTALANKADTATTYTKTEVDTALAAKANTATTYTKTEVDTALANKADTSAVTEAISSAVSGKVNTSAYNAYTAATDSRLAEDEEVTAAGLNALNDALSGKQDTLIAGSGITISGNVISSEGGGATVDPTLDSGSTNPVANSAITNAFNTYTARKDNDDGITRFWSWKTPKNPYGANQIYNFSINGKLPLSKETRNSDYGNIFNFHLVETSAITSAITSTSTNAEVAGAKAVYDAIQAGGGGGATYSAGTNISIANDTINCTLPIKTISNSYGTRQIYVGDNIYKNNNYGAIVIANKDDSSTGETRVEFAEGAISIGSTNNVFHNGIAIGKKATAGAQNVWGCVAIGSNVAATGTTKMNLNNQIKVDTNNQVYIKDKTNTTDVCIQDAIAALGGLKLVKLTQAAYDQLATKDPNTLYIVTDS